MKWTENLECDSVAANQVGPSNAETNQVDRMGPSNIINKTAIAPKDEENNQNDDKDPTRNKKLSPIELFAEKVTIAGLLEAYKAEYKPDRIMFRVALIAATCMMIYQGIAIANQYTGQNTIFLDQQASDRAPFPSVTVCIPTILNDIPFPHISNLTKRDADFVLKHNLTTDDANNFVNEFFSLNVKGSDMGTPLAVMTKKLFSSVLKSMSENGQISSLKKIFTLPCAQILSNCQIEGRKFDCCDGAQFLTTLSLSCFQINGALFEENSKSETRNSLRLEDNGLTFDVAINWTNGIYQSGSASDGFHVFIDTLPSLFHVPVPVPAGMSAFITLAQAKKISKITHCFSTGQAPKLKYFDTYDQNGASCKMEAIIDLHYGSVGCLMPQLSFFPTNQTCTVEQLLAIGLTVTDANTIKTDDAFSKVLKRQTDKAIQSMAILFSDQSPCKPLCTKWTRPVFSTSYGSIKYRDKVEERRQLANRSWSRIRIISGHDSYTYSQEKAVAASYMAVCEIGGMMGVWAGFSMITFAQVLFYGYHILWSKLRVKKRSGKVGPSQL